MNIPAVELKLPPQQYDQLTVVARERQVQVEEVIQIVITEWLERQARLECARTLMRELGQGIGKSQISGAVAREHDDYLYPRKQR